MVLDGKRIFWQIYFLSQRVWEVSIMKAEGGGEGFALWILFYIYELLHFSRKTSIIRRQVLQTITTKLYPHFYHLTIGFPRHFPAFRQYKNTRASVIQRIRFQTHCQRPLKESSTTEGAIHFISSGKKQTKVTSVWMGLIWPLQNEREISVKVAIIVRKSHI